MSGPLKMLGKDGNFYPTNLAIVASHPIQYQAPLFRALQQRIDVTVFYAHRAGKLDQAEAGFGIGFEWDGDLFSGYKSVFLRNAAKRPGLGHFAGCDTPEIGMRLRDRAFDAVLIQGWHLKSFLQAVFAAKRLGLPVLVRGDSHLDTPRSAIKRAGKAIVYPAFLRLFDAALYVGERSHAYWQHYSYPEKRLFHSPHCVDNDWFAARATPEARRVVRARFNIAPNASVALFAGKLVPFKRPLDLIAAAALMKDGGREIAVMVAGAGPLEIDMTRAAREAGVSYHSLGFCNQSEMPEAYAAADILVLPSDARETWGLVANEALACGRPIVLADTVGSAPDLAADQTIGRVFPVSDIAALANAISSLLRNPPSPDLIATKSAAFSPTIAANGILDAVEFAVRARTSLAA
jgi:glycosyltransferase involved in cell wall biosynthesis